MKLIFLESTTEGAGKTTQTSLFAKANKTTIKFPNNNVRTITLDETSSKTLIVLANLLQMSRELTKLESDNIVICDRSLLSTIAYQELDLNDTIKAWTAAGLPAPDLTIILDLPEELARERRILRGEELRIAERDNISKRDIILETSKHPWFNSVTIDASGDPQEVFNQLERVINDRQIYGSTGSSSSS